jgi:hypothetical protein
MLGAEINVTQPNLAIVGNVITGFIYEFCHYTTPLASLSPSLVNPSACGKGYCRVCPKETSAVCLIDCEFDQYIEDGICYDCSNTCDEGCVRGENCNKCLDPECGVCEQYEVCEACISGTNDDLTDCVCLDVYNVDDHVCEECFASCETCSSAGEYNCEKCVAGQILQPNSSFC